MFIYPRLSLILHYRVEEQPCRTMPTNAKDIELHPKNGCLNPSLISDGAQIKQINNQPKESKSKYMLIR